MKFKQTEQFQYYSSKQLLVIFYGINNESQTILRKSPWCNS